MTIDRMTQSNEWQPIETAPKPIAGEGVYIDLYSTELHASFSRCFYSPEDGAWVMRYVSLVNGLRTTQFFEAMKPSHWMPSPAKPELPEGPTP
jgi:hypothetical protein